MRYSRLTMSCLCGVLALGTVCLVTEKVHAVVAPSTWTTDIQVQGEAEGTEFDDWAASGIPIAIDNDPADNFPLVDIHTVQIANDDDFIYLHVTYHGNLSVGTLLAFDTDQDPNTGFNVFDLGEIGSELGYLNDYPFEQAPGVFDTTDPLTGGPVGDPPGNGGALIFPFFNVNGPQKEYAIPLDVGYTNPVEPAFTSNTFNLMVYYDQGLGDVTEVITYTLASAPAVDGDFDGDLDVDGADFLLWQRDQSVGSLSDWEANFGTPAATTAISSVPEPGCFTLVAMAMLGILYRKQRG